MNIGSINYICINLKPMDKDKNLTVNEFADFVGVTPYTVRQWIKKQLIIAEKVRKGLMYSYLIKRSEADKIAKLAK